MKRRLKCFFTLITASVFALFGSACGSKTLLNLIDDSDTSPTFLSFFSSSTFSGTDVTKYWSDLFTEQYNKKVYINFDGAAYYSDTNMSYRELLLKRLESSAPDDMYIINAEDVIEFEKKDYWMDLSDMDFINNLSDAALYQSMYNDKVFSVPLSFIGFGFAWNVDMLNAFGLTVPHNLAEFKNVCLKLKENNKLPYGANKGFALTVPAMCMGLADLYANENRQEEIDKLNSGTPISSYMEKGFDFLQFMIDQDYLDPAQAMNTTPGKEDIDMFLKGDCAFICIGMGNLEVNVPSFTWQHTGLPVLENGCISVYGANNRLCVNPKSKHMDTVREFIEMVGSTEALNQSAALDNALSTAKGDNKEAKPYERQLISLLRQSNQVPNQDFALHFNTWESIRDAGRLLCQGQTVDEVCNWLDAQQIDDLLDYGKLPIDGI